MSPIDLGYNERRMTLRTCILEMLDDPFDELFGARLDIPRCEGVGAVESVLDEIVAAAEGGDGSFTHFVLFGVPVLYWFRSRLIYVGEGLKSHTFFDLFAFLMSVLFNLWKGSLFLQWNLIEIDKEFSIVIGFCE